MRKMKKQSNLEKTATLVLVALVCPLVLPIVVQMQEEK